ncbi:DUF4282 domain-containing protein [Actinoallomurus sp. NPDC052274]|uniref:DUF4282 domain-containing protein n=1 Tax=Actinoallomurus sp. NPDC052274 TaxID=3155420 RepID=UPI0034306D25
MTDPARQGSIPPDARTPYSPGGPPSPDQGAESAPQGYGQGPYSPGYDPAYASGHHPAYAPGNDPASAPSAYGPLYPPAESLVAPDQAGPATTGEKPPTGPIGKGLFGSLFDRSFDSLVTTKLLRMLYTLAIVCVTGFNLVFFLFGWSLAAGSFWPFLGWVIVMGVPVMWLAELVMARVVVEYLIVQHKISTDLTIVREVVKEMRAAAEQ